MRILLVEDDEMIGESVAAGLRLAGHAVDWVRDGGAADAALSPPVHDMVLLDLGLPRKSGLELLKGVRASGADLAVLVITARDAVADRIAGLDAGADDYIVKPFDLDELAARMRAVARRRAGRAAPEIEYGDLRLDPAKRRAFVDGREVALSGREFAVLEALLERPDAVLSRAQIEERLYGWRQEIESNAVEVHIHALRRKLGADVIRTLRGVGYTMAKP
jgi:two-component system, OmpR family, response regulator